LRGYYPALGAAEPVKADLDVLAALDLTPLSTIEPELAYLFKHIVTYEVAYESLAYATRATLHEEYARFIEAQAGDATQQYFNHDRELHCRSLSAMPA